MDREGLRRIAFDEWRRIGDVASEPMPGARANGDIGGVDTSAESTLAGDLLALTLAPCARAVACCLDRNAEALLARRVDCRLRAPVARGAWLRISGWVEGLGEAAVVLRVHAHDEHEEICEVTVELAVVHPGEVARRIAHKRAARARRALFGAA